MLYPMLLNCADLNNVSPLSLRVILDWAPNLAFTASPFWVECVTFTLTEPWCRRARSLHTTASPAEVVQRGAVSTESTCSCVHSEVGVSSHSTGRLSYHAWASGCIISMTPASVGKAGTKADQFTQPIFGTYLCVLSNRNCCCHSCSHENKHSSVACEGTLQLLPHQETALTLDLVNKKHIKNYIFLVSNIAGQQWLSEIRF